MRRSTETTRRVCPRLAAIGSWEPVDATYPGPVLWIAGTESDYVRPDYADAMRALFPRTRQLKVRGAGHWVHADAPQIVIEAIRTFIARDTPDASVPNATRENPNAD